ncbi:MAG: phosphodiester glycosidase family protein [Verrucomicrobiota bacterium JB023]|nr:phosphodiester glycosidase family protein [Verrucomicrobiota bacterium JB023]
MKLILLAILTLSLLPLAGEYRRADLVTSPDGRKGSMHLYAFDKSQYRLKVIERGRFESLAEAMGKHRCVAGCNGGFYHPDGRPLGQVIASGKTSGSVNKRSALASGVVYQTANTLAIERAAAFYSRRVEASQLLQSGPFLIENGEVVGGLSDRRLARRTFIATNGKGQWFIAYTPPITLAQLARSLKGPSPAFGGRIETALNLDGGASSGLWIRTGSGNNPLYFRELNPVANFLGVVPK